MIKKNTVMFQRAWTLSLGQTMSPCNMLRHQCVGVMSFASPRSGTDKKPVLCRFTWCKTPAFLWRKECFIQRTTWQRNLGAQSCRIMAQYGSWCNDQGNEHYNDSMWLLLSQPKVMFLSEDRGVAVDLSSLKAVRLEKSLSFGPMFP